MCCLSFSLGSSGEPGSTRPVPESQAPCPARSSDSTCQRLTVADAGRSVEMPCVDVAVRCSNEPMYGSAFLCYGISIEGGMKCVVFSVYNNPKRPQTKVNRQEFPAKAGPCSISSSP